MSGEMVNLLAGFWVLLAPRAAYFYPRAPAEMEEKRVRRVIFPHQHPASFLQVFLQLECISLNRKIKVPNRRSTGQVAHGATG